MTAEFSLKGEADPAKFHNGMVEIGLLTVMVLALVASLLMLKRRDRVEPAALVTGK